MIQHFLDRECQSLWFAFRQKSLKEASYLRVESRRHERSRLKCAAD